MTLIYYGRLPKLSNGYVHPMARHRLKNAAFKTLCANIPPMLHPTTHAHVQIVRVLGRGQKIMDEQDNLRIWLKGLVDALKPCYIVDDSPKWTTFPPYEQDTTRRHLGPFIEIKITYESHPNIRR